MSVPFPVRARRALAFVCVLPLCAASALASTRYVDVNLATGANNGTSWADAYQGVLGVQTALTAAVAGDQIWVAQGTYLPTNTLTRSIHFNLKTGVELYGGFVGGETLLAQRNFGVNPTILSADLAGNDGSAIFTDNSFHVINGNGAAASAVVDGFFITGGNANGASTNQDRGGGLLLVTGSNATFRNCVVTTNRCTFGGGAGYINGAAPSFENVVFEFNVGGSFGGAFDMNGGTNTVFRRCVFNGNSAARAGAVEIFASTNVSLTNCLFFGNTATNTGANAGGGLWIGSSSNATLRFCTIVGNNSPNSTGAGLFSSATANVANSILWFNTGSGGTQTSANQIQGATVTYSSVQGGSAGTGNLAVDPAFVSIGGGDYRLSAGSPCIDAANNAASPAGTFGDLLNQPRFTDDPATVDTGAGVAPLCDMGCFEFQPPPFFAFCSGDGSLVDHTTPCPCGNNGLAGRGCGHSFDANGALLGASGTAAADDVVLHSEFEPANSFTLFMQHDADGDAVFHDGVLCAAGTLIRLRGRSAAGGEAFFPNSLFANDSTLTLSQRGAVTVGSGARRFYAAWYRNASTTFCPPATANVTNGFVIVW